MKSLRSFALLGAALLATVPLGAQTFNESGDAGQTPGAAQNSGLTQSNVVGTTIMILGNISGINDADVFRLTLTLPTQVQFSTANAVTAANGPGGLDTELFLFSNTGVPIYANNDVSGTVLQSRLPSGTSFTLTLGPGTYLIGISLSGNEPMNSNGQLVFTSSAQPTDIRGPAPALNPAFFSNFNNGATFAESGNYQIDISTMAVVPEPSTVSLLLGALVLGFFFFRKRSATQNS